MSESITRESRLAVLDALSRYETNSTTMRGILREIDSTNNLTSATRSSLFLLALGVVRYRNTIDFIIARSTRNPKGLSINDRNTLRLAIYETRWLESSVSSIEVDYLTKPNLQKIFVGSLKVDLDRDIEKLSQFNQISVQFSHPTFMVQTLLKNMAYSDVISLMEENNRSRNYYIRVNHLKPDSSAVLDELHSLDAEIHEDPEVPGLFVVKSGVEKIMRSQLLGENKVLIQDKASVLVSRALSPSPGETIWDACAAPGQKTQLLWEMMGQDGQLIATEIHHQRYKQTKTRFEELGVTDIDFKQGDAAKCPVENADKILIDAPCTSTGMIQSHPSFKWLLNKKKLFGLMSIQNKILDGIIEGYSERPGTEILYSTCSVLPHEGESQIDSVVDRYGVELLEVPIEGSPGYPDFNCSKFVRRLFPQKHKSQGFFIARFRIKS
ncbi:MAG: RsmB/NOP family class I SAM-dependent RNA methyltransferase [Candidatus Thorarchaeota archaeon]